MFQKKDYDDQGTPLIPTEILPLYHPFYFYSREESLSKTVIQATEEI
jgi:hypothetical protein